MNRLHRWLCAGALLLAPPLAIAVEPGWFAAVAVGRTAYDADCSVYLSCSGGRGNAAKLGVGYQFGVFGLEGWLVNYGKSALGSGDDVRLTSVGVNAVWRWRWGPVVQTMVRAGVASVQQSRTTEHFRSAQSTLGLGLAMEVAPSVAVELAWDLVTSTGGSNRIGTVIAQPVSLGLRVHF